MFTWRFQSSWHQYLLLIFELLISHLGAKNERDDASRVFCSFNFTDAANAITGNTIFDAESDKQEGKIALHFGTITQAPLQNKTVEKMFA